MNVLKPNPSHVSLFDQTAFTLKHSQLKQAEDLTRYTFSRDIFAEPHPKVCSAFRDDLFSHARKQYKIAEIDNLPILNALKSD